MTTAYDKQKKLHFDLTNVGLRAQATAVGLVQLCHELKRANVLDEAAIDRIKDAIADEVSVTAPRSLAAKGYRGEIRTRLDRLFDGEQQVGSADAMALGHQPE
ncbi:hypothetical protein [Sphingomonas sp. PvP056]|jgi:hypothetical protein|uniref:hypothetical protein n=1 Tax=Sphingomonas sp. PvP056 TaxID=3156392 RepID=UPI00339B0642